jgi:hypothetical protein
MRCPARGVEEAWNSSSTRGRYPSFIVTASVTTMAQATARSVTVSKGARDPADGDAREPCVYDEKDDEDGPTERDAAGEHDHDGERERQYAVPVGCIQKNQAQGREDDGRGAQKPWCSPESEHREHPDPAEGRGKGKDYRVDEISIETAAKREVVVDVLRAPERAVHRRAIHQRRVVDEHVHKDRKAHERNEPPFETPVVVG